MDEKAIWYNIRLKPNKFYDGTEGSPTHKAAVPVNGRWVTVAVLRAGEGDEYKLSLSRDGLAQYIKNQKAFAESKKAQAYQPRPVAPKPFNQEDTVNPDDLPF